MLVPCAHPAPFQLVLIFGWGFSTASKVDPWDLGAAMVTVWPAVLLTLLGGLIWRAKGWHMGPVNRYNWFTALQTFFAIAGVMVIVWCVHAAGHADACLPVLWGDAAARSRRSHAIARACTVALALGSPRREVCVIFVGQWSYLSVSWVFLSINMILVIMAVFAAFAAPEGCVACGMQHGGGPRSSSVFAYRTSTCRPCQCTPALLLLLRWTAAGHHVAAVRACTALDEPAPDSTRHRCCRCSCGCPQVHERWSAGPSHRLHRPP